MIDLTLHMEGTTRFTICVGRLAFKIARGRRGRVANYAERVEWERATPQRREILCPLLWAAPFGLFNVMRWAIPLTRKEQLSLLDTDGFADWDYMPGGPSSPFEYQESDWGYFRTFIDWRDPGPSASGERQSETCDNFK
jgi:hypothetical protein